MANYDTETPGAPGALPEPAGTPWVTMIATLLILFVFGGLVVFLYEYASSMTASQQPASGEQQLQELRTQERAILDHDGYDPATKTWRIPIDRAMTVLIQEGKTNGDIKSFPVPVKEKK